MNSAATMDMLESCLKANAFLAGSNATKVDAVAFESFKGKEPSYWKNRHLCTWYHKINALTEKERKALPGNETTVRR